jgi:hypothetical protein
VTTRTRLNLLPALLAVLLGAAVAVAARGRTWSTHAGQSGWSTRTFALIVIAGVGLVALLLTRTIWRHRSSEITWPLALGTLAPVVLIVLALTVVALLWHRMTPRLCSPACGKPILVQGSGGGPPSGAGGNASGPGAQGKVVTLKAIHSHSQPMSWLWVWLALAGLVIGTALWIWRRRPIGNALSTWRRRQARQRTLQRQPGAQPETSELTTAESDPAETTTRYIDASLDDLRREPDLRRAIIACYARMEQLFAHTGSPRQQWETPFEFLRRADAANGKPLDQLTVLYEEAQFSPHPLDEQHRAEAIAALTTLRGQLRLQPT